MINLYDRISELENQKNNAYKERNLCVALIAKLALQLGYKVGGSLHVGDNWDDDWRHIVFIDIPTGQLSWHIHDSEVPNFNFLSEYPGAWDGHTTEEKYNRIKSWTQNTQ